MSVYYMSFTSSKYAISSRESCRRDRICTSPVREGRVLLRMTKSLHVWFCFLNIIRATIKNYPLWIIMKFKYLKFDEAREILKPEFYSISLLKVTKVNFCLNCFKEKIMLPCNPLKTCFLFIRFLISHLRLIHKGRLVKNIGCSLSVLVSIIH